MTEIKVKCQPCKGFGYLDHTGEPLGIGWSGVMVCTGCGGSGVKKE